MPRIAENAPSSRPDDTIDIERLRHDLSPAIGEDDRPILAYYEAELSQTVTRACKLVLDAGVALYARGTSLYRLVRIEGAEMSVLVPAEEVSLIEIFSRTILWLKPDARTARGWKAVSCPPLVARAVITRRGEWSFPQLKAIVSTPTMRGDGTIINAKGFDRQTGILFESDETWPDIPECPGRADAAKALGTIEQLLSSFPFVSEVDRAAAVALILTAIVRPCLKTAPLFGVNATAPGTGKSKLVDVAAILSTGRVAAVDSYPSDGEELRKTIAARLMQGAGFLSLDNVSSAIQSDFLCQLLAQQEVSTRVLGESRTVGLPTAVTLCATGNGLRFAGDLTRRAVLINLDARVERPEERVFDSDVVEVARERRVEIVTAGLTVLRAFVANCGDTVSPALGSFEHWSDLVRSALVWLGSADPLANSIKIRDNDPEKERMSAIIAALPAGRPWTAFEIAGMVEEGAFDPPGNRRHEALMEALSEFIDRGRLKTARFGGFLRKHSGRIVNGQMIVSAGKNRLNAVLWKVETMDARSGDAP